jgi:hypothetical protein
MRAASTQAGHSPASLRHVAQIALPQDRQGAAEGTAWWK